MPGAPVLLEFTAQPTGHDAAPAAAGRLAGPSAAAGPLYRVVLTWLPPATGGKPSEYILESGTVLGGTDLVVYPTGTTSTQAEAVAPAGVYFVRVRARNDYGVGAPSSEVQIRLGEPACSAPPAAPTLLTADVTDLRMQLTWNAALGATSYLLDIGATPGGSENGSRNIGGLTTFVAAGAPGLYYVRVRGLNACGAGPASNEVALTLSTAIIAPGLPNGLTHLVTGRMVSFAWQPPVSGGAPDNYIVEAGSQPGLVNVGTLMTLTETLTNPNAPPGTYFVRVRAMNVAGIGPATADVQVDVV